MGARILVVDDDSDIRTFLRITLELDGHDVTEAPNGADGVAAALADQPDLVLMDLMMPHVDGIEAVRRLRSDARTSHIPIIVLTAKSQPDDKIAGLTAGADDYVTKPFDATELTARIEATLKRASEMRSLSPLTGLPGNPRIHQEISRRLNDSEPFAMLYADLNHFKAYNDHYGFLRGDGVLRALSNLLVDVSTSIGGEGTFVGHVGGDDFVVICPVEAAEEICERITEEFDRLAPAFYDEVDRGRGAIEVTDRQGFVRKFPIVAVALGATSTALGPIEHPGELVEVATEMKRHAKGLDDRTSTWAIDRRRRPREVMPT